MIRRRGRVGVLDLSENKFNDNDEVRYCPHCEQYGFKEKLEPRIYQKMNPSQVIPIIGKCAGSVALSMLYMNYQRNRQITDVVQTTDSPFESGKDFLGIGSRKLRNKRIKEQELDYIEDEDVKRELKKGSTLLSYSEQMP